MKIYVNGNLRTIANSAWISTMSELRAKSRSDADVERVVNFLVENNHTSPLESVTLSFVDKSDNFHQNSICEVVNSRFSKVTEESGNTFCTIDLLNFVKCSIKYINSNNKPKMLELFQNHDRKMSDIVMKLPQKMNFEGDKRLDDFFAEDISVELIDVHDPFSNLEIKDNHCRATWRVKCPLSIAVQILRHRSGSFNMVSARYKTIKQSLVEPFNDLDLISSEINIKDELYKTLFSKAKSSINFYLNFMKNIKILKNNKKLKNEEYKRLREVSRYILPEGRMTELYISFYLKDFKNYILLRESEHTQLEHAYIANKMRVLLEDKIERSLF